MGRVGLVLGICCAVAAGGATRAADFLPDLKSSNGYTVTVGVDARAVPRYEGSSRSEVLPIPYFDVRPMGTPARFVSPRDGVSVALFEAGRFSMGPVAHVEQVSKRRDSALSDLTDTRWVVELGAYAEFWPTSWLRAYGELRKGVTGQYGVVFDGALDAVVPLNETWTTSGGPRIRIADSTANSRYFDVSLQEALASGLPAFDARGGIRSVGVGGKLRYQWSPQWAAHTYVEYDRLVGNAADSPIVALRGTPNQTSVGAGVTYSIDVPRWH
jgi:outer membrane protein